MSEEERRKFNWWPVVGYVILALSVTIALYFGYRNASKIRTERQQRSAAINVYLVQQCSREKRKDAVIISILRDSQQSVSKDQALDQAFRHAYVARIQTKIDALDALDFACVSAIPPVTLPH